MTSRTPKSLPLPKATLSLDIDNLWCYQRNFGVGSWRHYPSFLELALPRILDLLDRLNLRLTVFIIGRDAANPVNRTMLADFVRRGHEAGNHSYDHELDLHRWPRDRIKDEIQRAAHAIAEATGQKPRGFRGPAFGLSLSLLEVLAELNYDYDASNCPSSLGLVARLYHRKQASKLGNRATVVDGLYGDLKGCRLPLRPYSWTLAGGSVIEAPVSTLPLLRLPFHGTYLNYLADFSPGLGSGYFGVALRLCRLRAIPPSFLMHATDFLGCDELPELSYLPGMKRSGKEKTGFMAGLLETYKQAFQVQPIGAYVDDLGPISRLRQLSPAFDS